MKHIIKDFDLSVVENKRENFLGIGLKMFKPTNFIKNIIDVFISRSFSKNKEVSISFNPIKEELIIKIKLKDIEND